MGVQGLMGFVRKNGHILEQVEFRDSKLGIDGQTIYDQLYVDSGLEQRQGGEYDGFKDLISQIRL